MHGSVNIYFIAGGIVTLEPKGSEKPLVLASMIALGKLLLDKVPALLASLWSLCVSARGRESGHVDTGPDCVTEVERVACGHEMIVIDDFDEDGHVGTESDLLLGHGLFHATGILFDAGDDAVTVGMLVCAVVMVLKDYGLLAGVFALQKDYDLRRFQARVSWDTEQDTERFLQ